MASTICRKCGSSCEVIFRPYIKRNGKVIYPKKGGVFPIPVCPCENKAAA